ncbi:hypothetical protein Hanom_Chr16g01509771 [Helianthus anomalus]
MLSNICKKLCLARSIYEPSSGLNKQTSRAGSFKFEFELEPGSARLQPCPNLRTRKP